ncbi:MAG: DUF1302 domain-containing protein [Planctomycetes bacterium]|nr:DUF1302 domain-containing protein [Planctomycetota bacterium]
MGILKILFLSLALLVLTKHSSPLFALEIKVGEDVLTGSFDTTVLTGATWRVEGRDKDFIGASNGGRSLSVNGDDGNINYGTGFVSQIAKATHELGVKYRNFGLFIRGNYFYDLRNHNKRGLSRRAKSVVGKDATLLDAYLSGHFSIDDHPLNIRLGSQVLNWGESTFIQNGINVINTVNLSRLRTPGSELRDALIPSPMISASFDITDNLTIEGFYQFSFEHIEIDPPGTYFSVSDVVGKGGDVLWLGPEGTPDAGIPRSDRRAKDSGQYGVALHVFVPALNDTEFGLFYIKYHSRLPLLGVRTGTFAGVLSGDYAASARYIVEYPEDIHLFGVSFNTMLERSGIAVQGEISYRDDAPLQIDDNELVPIIFTPLTSAPTQLGTFGLNERVRGFRDRKVGQAQVTASRVFGPDNPFKATNILVMAEVGLTRVFDMEHKRTLKYDGPVNSTADAFSWGYVISAQMDYTNAIGAVTLSPTAAFSHDVNGITPGPGVNFVEGRKALTLGLKAKYLEKWQAGVSYTNYFGREHLNPIHDRDFVTFNIKYFF